MRKYLTVDRCFILKNQDGHSWGRSKEWVDGADRSRVALYKHRYEASNTVFALSSNDFGLRSDVLAMTLSNGKLPTLPLRQLALPRLAATDEERRAESSEERREEAGT